MRAFTVPVRRPTVERKTWQWNSAQLIAERKRAEELQTAQRRFRNVTQGK